MSSPTSSVNVSRVGSCPRRAGQGPDLRRGAAGGKIARHQRDRGEHDGHACKCRDVEQADAEQPALHQPGGRGCQCQSYTYPHGAESHAFSDHHPEHVATRGAEREADADLASAAAGREP